MKGKIKIKDKELRLLNKECGWVECGVYYGYPKCCIIAFCRGKDLLGHEDEVHNFYGFIPCDKCSKKILEGKTTLEKLIKNRICKTKFPQGDY